MSLVVMRRKYRCTRNETNGKLIKINLISKSCVVRRKHPEISNSNQQLKEIYTEINIVVGGSSVTNNKSINYRCYNKKH